VPNLSQYTDDELRQAAEVSPAVSSISSMSDDDLLKIANQPVAPSVPLISGQDIEERFNLIRQFTGPELEKKSRNAASIAATFDISEGTAFDIHDSFLQKMDTINIWDKATGSFKAGWGDMYSSIGGIMKRKGISPEWADNYVDFGERLKRAYIPPSDQSDFTWRKMKDPEWYATTIMRSVPFTLSLVPAAIVGAYAGVAVAGAAGLGAFGTTVLGAIGGAALSRPAESAFEAQGAYEEAKQKGFTDEDAEGAANQVYWDNMKLVGLDAAEFATAFMPMGKIAGSTVKRAMGKRVLAATGKLGAVGVMEMGEERYQESAVMDATGQDVSFFDFSNPRLNEAGAAGAVFGVGLGGAGSVWTALRSKVTDTMPETSKQIYEKAKESALSQGAEDTAAEALGLDAVASTPEGKAHIESVVSDLKDLTEGKPAKEKVKTEGTGQPFIIGVNEDSAGVVTGFTMADPVSGQTFEVAATKEEGRGDITRTTPDMAAVNQKIQELRKEQPDEIDTQIDQLIQGDEDINKIVNDIFGDEIVEPGVTSGGKQPLIEEARKYKSAEEWTQSISQKTRPASEVKEGEFVKFTPPETSRGEGILKPWYGKERLNQFNDGSVMGRVIKINPKSITIKVENAGAWNDGHIYKIPKEANATTDMSPYFDKSQADLTDIWNKAQEGKGTKLNDVSSILNPVEIVNTLKGLTSNIKEAMPHLEALGAQVYQSGKVKFNEWSAQMKETLGDLWESFRDAVNKLWANREKWVGNEIGAIGNIESPIHDVIAYIKENGGLNIDILSKQYPKETIDILKKKGLAKKDGYMQLDVVANEFQFEDDDLMNQILDVKSKNKIKAETSNKRQADYLKSVYNNEKVSREEFTKAVNDARKAFKEGNAAELSRLKNSIKWMAKRKDTLKNVRDYFGLTDNDMSKISKQNPLLMDEQEFAQYLKDVNYKAVELSDNRWAKIELMKLIEDRRLQKVDNYRRAMQLPSLNEMTTEQLREFAKLLEPFQNDDVFLTQRELETVDRTDVLKGTRTWREAREVMVREIQTRHPEIELKDLAGVKVAWNANWKWDSALREQDPFFELLVHDMATANISADMKVYDVETKVFDLAKKAEKSRKRTLSEKLIPQDKQIFEWLEAPAVEKEAIAHQMTGDQLNYAHFMIQYFADALDYLISIKAVEKGRENYITHVRKTFMENVRDKGLTKASSEMFKQMEEDQMTFTILDDDTGNILPLEKFFQFQMHRNGGLDPTTNVTRAFMTYVRTFERKKMYDAIIPKLDIYTQSLTPTIYTPRGLEVDASLKKFVNIWINNNKGRHISFNSVIRQGGPLDVMLRVSKTFTSMLDLGFFVYAQTINIMGEQLGTMVPLGVKDYAKSIALIRTEKGKRILDKYEAFTGRSFWENFTAPGKQANERVISAMFGIFHVSTVAANKQFLLASMSEQEWANEELSVERLAEIKLEMGRFRAVPGDSSIIGSTSLGASVFQYKTWAVSPTRTLIKDISIMTKGLKNKKPGEALTSKEAREVYRIVGTTMSIVMLIAMAGAEDDDRSTLGKMKARAIREMFSMTAGTDPVFWLSWRTASWFAQLGTAMKNLLFLETYKTKDELKGAAQLKKAFIPGAIRNLGDSDNNDRI